MGLQAELNQAILRGGQRLPSALVTKALRACAEGMRFRGDALLSVAFVSEKEIRRLNKHYRGKDKVTDVLSFEEPKEILLCYAQAKRQARQLQHSTRDELIFLLVHGVLHAFGYDHIRAQDARQMFPLQTRILNRLGIDPRL